MELLATIQEIAAVVLMLGGVGFMLIGSIGINTLPDFYTRCHASGKVDTLGIVLLLMGMMVHQGPNLNSLKLVLVLCFVLVTSPVATHFLMRRAFIAGFKFWSRPEADKEKDDAALAD
ncbi:MAG: monovalent cation/H(+) antiporter subunit G [Desulfobacterales bacterium]|jgi:multicomponent Na+:H+ antiporter subunit G|nr:monovalent cation/H(+) antiporter subunit G [Desulfobacterales bacterium]